MTMYGSRDYVIKGIVASFLLFLLVTHSAVDTHSEDTEAAQ